MAAKRLASKRIPSRKYPKNPRDFLSYSSGNILRYVGDHDHRVRFIDVADEPMMLRVSDNGNVVLVNRNLVEFMQRPRIHKGGKSMGPFFVRSGNKRRRTHGRHVY
jgi:hypothetical protein